MHCSHSLSVSPLPTETHPRTPTTQSLLHTYPCLERPQAPTETQRGPGNYGHGSKWDSLVSQNMPARDELMTGRVPIYEAGRWGPLILGLPQSGL